MWQPIAKKQPGKSKQPVLCAWEPTGGSTQWFFEVFIHWPDDTWTDALEREIEPDEMPDLWSAIVSPGDHGKSKRRPPKKEQDQACP